MEKELVEKCINTGWLGYGNINSLYWFLGIEEGGAEIIAGDDSKTRGRLTLKASLKIRSEFNMAEDFYDVWLDKYGYKQDFEKILKRPTTWKFIAAFLLAFNNEKINRENIQKFLLDDKRLGQIKGSHFMCEFYPLPKPSINDWNETYKSKSVYKTNKDYYNGIKEKRLNLLKEAIDESNELRLIISYKKNIREVLNVFQFDKLHADLAQGFELYKIQIESREIKLLITPFFGNGRISYANILQTVEHLKRKNYLT